MKWRINDEPQLPDCTFAVHIGAACGRLEDESLKAISLLDDDYKSSAGWYADPIMELPTDMRKLLATSERAA